MTPTVELLSEITWARVERDVFARLDAERTVRRDPSGSPRRWWWLALPVAISAAAVIIAVRTPAPAPVLDNDWQWSRVVAGASPSMVTFGDADVALDADSAVVLQRQVSRPVVWLERGAAWFSVAPRAGREPFIVLAGETTVRVIGTRFRVARDGERTDVTVDHGVVDVQYRGDIVHVAAGQTWSTVIPSPPAPPTPSPVSPPPAPAPMPRATPRATPAPAPAPPEAPPAAVETDQQRYEALAQIEAKQPDTAIRGYLELSRGTSEWAALALYSAGRLAADHHEPRAATLLTIYLQRFPTGANAADVTYLLDRLQGASR